MNGSEKVNADIMELFARNELVKIAAPMVRYSKLQFRTLVRAFGCDLCFTPMVLADSFRCSSKARDNEFTTSLGDDPVIVQFASSNVDDFVAAAEFISPYASGVDLNCGCPQRWAKHIGVGCCLLQKPELVSDMIRQCRNRIPKPFAVSVKIRLLADQKKSIELCRQLEKAGVSFVSIHARTASQNTGPIDVAMLKGIVESVCCPVVANGNVKTFNDCMRLGEESGCRGVMCANGLLTNPTLFDGCSGVTTIDCVQKWIDICYNSTLDLYPCNPACTIFDKPPNLTFQCFHHHLVFMLEKIMPKTKRRIFNNLQTFRETLSFLNDELKIRPRLFSPEVFKRNSVLALIYPQQRVTRDVISEYDYEETDGKYFRSRVSSISYDLADLFI